MQNATLLPPATTPPTPTPTHHAYAPVEGTYEAVMVTAAVMYALEALLADLHTANLPCALVSERLDAAREYAEQAAVSAAYATTSAQAARRFVPQRGDLADLCRTHREAVWTWLHCPEGEPVKLAVLRARVEEAEAAVQAALPVPATA
jgi:hypothetical protein